VGRFLCIVLVWVVILGAGALAYKYFVLDREGGPGFVAKGDDTARDSGKVVPQPVVQPGPAPDAGKSAGKVRLALDAFSGYCVFRSPEFKKRLAARGIDFEWVDDKADYKKRMETVRDGDTPLAVFTIDALIAQTPPHGDPPAAIVMLIDETRGADAIVSYQQGVESLSDLNNPRAKIVLTADSPSEMLFRVVRSQFDLGELPAREKYLVAANPEKGAEDVYQQFLKTTPTDRKAFVLWEPYVSMALKQPGAQVLVDSSDFKGFIVDVLVVQQSYLDKNRDKVETIVRTYLDLLHETQKSRDGMAGLVQSDFSLIGEKPDREQAEKVARGIWWKNTVENYAHFGLLEEPAANKLQPVADMIQRITHALVETSEPNAPLPGCDRPDKLVVEDCLKQLYQQRTPFHLADEKTREEETAKPLSEAEWKRLGKVATIRVKQIEFSSTKRDELTDEDRDLLKPLASDLRMWPQYYLRVEGSTKKEGDPEANRALAERRADAVRDYLKEQGIDDYRIKTVAMPGEGAKVRFVALRPPR